MSEQVPGLYKIESVSAKKRSDVLEFVEIAEQLFPKLSLVYDFTIDRFQEENTNDAFELYRIGRRGSKKSGVIVM